MTIAALRVNTAVLTVFVLLTITFVFLTIGNWDAFGAHAQHHQVGRLVRPGNGGSGLVRLGGGVSLMRPTRESCSQSVHEANVRVTGGLTPDPTANSARPERYGRCWHLREDGQYSQER